MESRLEGVHEMLVIKEHHPSSHVPLDIPTQKVEDMEYYGHVPKVPMEN